ncbi:hypothetical protein, variant [Aphanomyces astaci]|uniref:Sm domain-containing protein n=1 Tax=Aphanomyces astaci TaxID=112090 RepID=W4FTG1_APHAT|nr:hypothetical protein, variant [Aphanomyces astaci]ETV69948.1 hypothetical protein, variant [Aphanomyces astaci]|eukprot:XP_009840685.1 hypothetical protein, variant [Aphanomyces astaci]
MEAWQRDRIVAFYESHNPENVKNIPEILRVFAGREDVLCAKLHKKYGCSPDIVAKEDNELSAAASYDPNFVPKTAPPSRGGPFDCRSASFNAHLALVRNRLDGASLHHPALDNLYKCRMLLPPRDPQFIQPKVKPATPSVTTDRKSKSTVAPKKPPVLHAIAAKARVVVVLRRISSIRGTCTGYLKGFDKHMNLVLMDVMDKFAPVHAQQQEAPTVTRHIRQLLIRGDNVVLVYPTQPLMPQQNTSSTGS